MALRRHADSASRMGARDRLSALPLGQLQRTDDALPPRPGLGHVSAAARILGRMETIGVRIRRDQIYRLLCADLRPPVLASVVRFSVQERQIRRLFSELDSG